MDNDKKLFEELLKADGITPKGSTESERLTFAEILDQQLEQKQSKPTSRPEIWRIIMQSKITKFSTAAVILIAALSITFFDKTATPAWALEDTIKAIKTFDGIHLSGIKTGDNGKEDKFELWARANEDFTNSEEFKSISDDGNILLVKDGKTFCYDPNTNIINVIPWKCASISPWIGSDLLEQMKKFCDKWEISFGKDAATNKDRIYLTCASTKKNDSWNFEFDAESKLPVRFRQWHNSNTEGKPQIDIQSIVYYDLMPEDVFELKAPENAELIKKFPSADKNQDKDANINSGMTIKDGPIEQSAIEITETYWHAVVNSDWEFAAKLRPSLNAKQRSELYSNSNLPTEIISIGSAYQQDGCTLGLVVPCKIRFTNDKTAEIKMIIRFVEIEETPICYVWGTWGNEYFGR